MLHYSTRCILEGSLCQTFRLVDFVFYKFSSVSAIEGCNFSSILSLSALKLTAAFPSPLSPFLSRLTAAVSSCQCHLCAPAPGGLPIPHPAGHRHPIMFLRSQLVRVCVIGIILVLNQSYRKLCLCSLSRGDVQVRLALPRTEIKRRGLYVAY